MKEAGGHKGPGGSTESRSFKEHIEWCRSNLDRAPWARSLVYIGWGAVDLNDLIATHRTLSGEQPPAVCELALLMLRTAIEMLLWRYPEGPVAEVVNAIGELPDKLERLIEDELNSRGSRPGEREDDEDLPRPPGPQEC